MSRGRRPDARAIRRSGGALEVTPTVLGEPGSLAKPATVAAVPSMSELWDTLVGSGSAFRAEDAPFVEQLVFDMETAAQCRARCVGPDGRVAVMVGAGEPDPETGEYAKMVPNPYLRQMREAVTEAMRLSDQLGLTPLARARLGLTQAAGIAAARSISEQIDAAIARRAR